MRKLEPAILCAYVSLGCNGAVDARPARPTVWDSGGVTYVENGLYGRWGRENAVLTEVLRIGKREGDPRDLLYNVSGAVRRGDGSIVVSGRTDGSVRIYDASGVFRTQFGGVGDGPGEFRMANHLQVFGDTIIVTDWQGIGKTAVFDGAGQLLRTWNHTYEGGEKRVTPIGPVSGGWVGSVDSVGSRGRLPPGTERSVLRTLYRLTTDGLLARRLFDLPPIRVYGNQRGQTDAPLFFPSLEVSLDNRGRVYVVMGDGYAIAVYDAATGSLVSRVSRGYRARPITDSDVDRIKVALGQVYDTLQIRLPPGTTVRDQRVLAMARIESRATFPRSETVPPMGRLLVGPNGEFWVERRDLVDVADFEAFTLFASFTIQRPWDTPWDVFDSNWELLGTVTVPARVAPMSVSKDHLVAVYKDEFDVEFITVYRVTAPPGTM